MSLKTELQQLLVMGTSQELDEALGMAAADPVADLRHTLSQIDTSGLQRLAKALREDRVTPRRYRDRGNDRGCLMYWAVGATSNSSFFAAFPDDEHLAPASRTIRFFDRGALPLETVKLHVEEALAARAEANEAEQAVLEHLFADVFAAIVT